MAASASLVAIYITCLLRSLAVNVTARRAKLPGKGDAAPLSHDLPRDFRNCRFSAARLARTTAHAWGRLGKNSNF